MKKYFSFLQEQGLLVMTRALLKDAIALSLVGLVGLLTLEGLMPGFVSAHLNLAKVLFLIAALILAFTAFQHTEDTLSPKAKNAPAWMVILLSAWSAVLVISSLIKFPFYAIIIILIAAATIVKLLYDEIG